MIEENQETNSTPVQNQPVKRKRGRPRKDQSVNRGEKVSVVTPRSDTVKRNPRRNINSTSNTDDEMVGQVVSGVLEGSFDAGYLVTVRVGDTNTVLRGVVFDPGLVLPISGANDVASNVKMIKRNEIPLDIASSLQGSAHQRTNEQAAKPLQPIPLKALPPVEKVSKVARTSPAKIPSSPTIHSKGVPFDINQVPQASPQAKQHEEIRNMSSAHLLVGEQASTVSQEVQVPFQSTNSQVERRKLIDILPKVKTDLFPKGGYNNVNQTEVLQECGILSLTEAALNDGDGTKDSKLGNNLKLSDETFPGNGTINRVPEVPRQVVGFERRPNQITDSSMKGQAVNLNNTPADAGAHFVAAEPSGDPIKSGEGSEINQISVAARSQSVTTQLIAELSKMWQENHMQSKCSVEMPRRDEISHLNERPLNEVMNALEGESQSKPNINQPVESSMLKLETDGIVYK